MEELPDVQDEGAAILLPIQKVGVTGVHMPVKVKDKADEIQHVTAEFDLSASLRNTQRGAHMSRFIDALEGQAGKTMSIKYLEEVMLPIIAGIQGAEKASIEMAFTYFIWGEAPVSRMKSKTPVSVTFEVMTDESPILEVIAPVMTVCPCSLEISEKGQAHNQRAAVMTRVQFNDWIWIEDLVQYAANCASAPVFGLLKRPDEKWITDHSHENPRFVEDVCRKMANILEMDIRIDWYSVAVISHESIHPHNAMASITKEKKDV